MLLHLDSRYLTWMYQQVEDADSEFGYWDLLTLLHSLRFEWVIPLDDNRGMDGIGLRRFFCEANDIRPDEGWLYEDCSFLEMLLALSRRMSMQTGWVTRQCFWHILGNLNLTNETDEAYIDAEYVSDRIYDVVWRSYSYSGEGGMFPLDTPKKDQREVEILYQMYAYILERRSLWTSST